ncbi:hypothetical protein [Crateriforma conspicua]|uniref:hypothetical protein n=1 Tax=Crateriforma conspicua TaxID=2527996 RepID=UPI00118892C7|nr:hypothetical protein [Crateriforma conspicua]QDV63783.1 hypothetical protein Mal65_29290 [Crateriforma conspicua]
MESFVATFEPKLAKKMDHYVGLAPQIWADADADYQRLAIVAGNYAGYGAYSARCHESGIIEFPIGNKKSVIGLNNKRQLGVADGADVLKVIGVLLHEIGHHVVNTAKREPWDDVQPIGPSTHLRSDWIWVCCTAWNYFQDSAIDPHDIASTIHDNRDEWVQALTLFSPFCKPPAIGGPPTCQHCGAAYRAKRRDAKFCSARCRVAAMRAKA